MPSFTERWIGGGGLIAVTFGLTIGLTLAFRDRPRTKHEPAELPKPSEHQPASREPPPRYFPNQPDPEVVILVSGQMYGFLQPCGCARPQTGGLERRFELLQELKKKGWLVSALDVGDVAPKANDPSRRLRAQHRVRFETAMQMLQKLEVAAVGLGLNELELPVDQALGLAQNYQPPHVLAANFANKDLAEAKLFRGWTVDDPGQRHPEKKSSPRIGYLGAIGEEVSRPARRKDATLELDPLPSPLPYLALSLLAHGSGTSHPSLLGAWGPSHPQLAGAYPLLGGQSFRDALAQLEAQRCDLLVLVFHGTRAEARMLAPGFPQFRVIVTLDDSDEPTALPERVGDQILVSTGHKGKNVGLVGVFKSDDEKRFNLKYQLVTLTEQFKLPEAKTNEVRELMKDYVLRVHRDNFLEEWPRFAHPLQVEFPEAKYAGAAACKECHPNAYKVWSNTKHSHAYENLAKYGEPIAVRERKGEPKRLIGRQYDPECARCHTTGFGHHTGFVSEQKTPHLRGNQCENCHGPASLHVAEPKNLKYSQALRLKIDSFEDQCRKCHDTDNDPKFNLSDYWVKIKHPRD